MFDGPALASREPTIIAAIASNRTNQRMVEDIGCAVSSTRQRFS
jgi:hypothetical protein